MLSTTGALLPCTFTVMLLVLVDVSVESMAEVEAVSMPSPAKMVTFSAELAVTRASSTAVTITVSAVLAETVACPPEVTFTVLAVLAVTLVSAEVVSVTVPVASVLKVPAVLFVTVAVTLFKEPSVDSMTNVVGRPEYVKLALASPLMLTLV